MYDEGDIYKETIMDNEVRSSLHFGSCIWELDAEILLWETELVPRS